MVIRRPGPGTPFPVSSRRSRSTSQRTSHMPRPVRLALLAGAVVWGAGAIAPSAATADVARLSSVAGTKPGTLPSRYRVVVTDQRGSRRSFGPVPLGRLFAAPNGRHLVVLTPEANDDPEGSRIVPLDGSPVRPLRLPAGTVIENGFSQVSWTPDGTELVVGDVLAWDPSAFADPSAIDDLDRFRWTALRCLLATGVCTEVPTPGLAVGVPGGILTTSSPLSSFPASWLLEGVREEQLPEWERPTSRRGRSWVRIAGDVRVTSTQLVGPPATTLGAVRRSGAAGIPVAVVAVGGPAGAVIFRFTFVTDLQHRRGRVRLNLRARSPRLLLAKPGAPLRAFASRPIVLPRRDVRRISKTTVGPGQRLHFFPRFATPDGWVGGGSPASLAPDLAVLATMDTEGRVVPVTVGGRPATGWALLRAARVRSTGPIAGSIEVIGYEAAGNAIVTVGYDFSDKELPGEPQRAVTLRVPLGGKGRPTVIRGGVDAAW